MVKSKKMSKTSIAVIVLAILLVLSLALGITGAWYTNRAAYTTTGDSHVFKMDSYFDLVITADEQAGLTVTRSTPTGPESIEPQASGDDQGKYLVLPGDVITAGTAAGIHVSASNAPRAFYYVYKVTGNANGADSANWYASATNNGTSATHEGTETYALLGSSSTTIDVTGLINNLTNETYLNASDNVYTIKTSLTTANVGDSFTLTIGTMTLEVRTMQAQNISADAAYNFLTGNNWAVENDKDNTSLAA